MEGRAGVLREVGVDRVADQIVAEPQPLVALLEDTGTDGELNRPQQPRGRPVQHERDVPE